MFFSESEIQSLNWRKDLINLSNKYGWVLKNDLDKIAKFEGFQYVPGEGLVFKLVKTNKGYFLLGPNSEINTGPEKIFRFFKLNKWGF